MLANGLPELGYAMGSAAVYSSASGVVLKVMAGMLAALLTKVLLPLCGHGTLPGARYVAAAGVASVGVYLGTASTARGKAAPSTSTRQASYFETQLVHASAVAACLRCDPNVGVCQMTPTVGFYLLTFSTAAWTLCQVEFASRFGIDHLGYMSLDQLYGSLLSFVVILALPAAPCAPSPTTSQRRAPLQLLRDVVHKTWGTMCSGPGSLLLFVSKVLSNGLIVVYFQMSTTYDPGMVVLETALVKTLLGWVYTVSLAVVCPTYIGFSADERREALAPRQVLRQGVGMVLIALALCVLA